MYKKEKLKSLVLEKAVKRGDFTLVSGKKSNYYINGKLVSLASEGLALIAEFYLAEIEGEDIEAVGGMTIGADPIVGAILTLADSKGIKLDGFLVRKEPKGHGTRSQVEGPVKDGAKVAIIEDVTTTGGSSLKAIEALKPLNCEIAKVITLVDRQQGAVENFKKWGYKFSSIFTKEELGL
ncbi:MAG: orotate phosphoribosyltransferase [candidate division Zixibacteria bacterium]|nr:orotate phosphoribosyltransferase [candidate division Zixibacteria bacterium]